MARLPKPGGDNGNWGEILNDFLLQSHTASGALKPGSVSKSDIGLSRVDNTADSDKPVSTAQQAAFTARRVHVIGLWGQSNMSGRGANYSSFLDPVMARIKQFGAGATQLTPAAEPLTMHDAPTGMGPGLQFARNYLEKLSDDDVVIVVPSAHGGTPLSSNAVPLSWRWSVSGNLSSLAVTQMQTALAAAQAAYPGATVSLDALLWFQGETDSSSSNMISRATYEADLDALIAGARSVFAVADLPFIVYRMIPEALGSGTRNVIDGCHQNTPYRVAHTGVVPSISGQSNGDSLHANATQHRLNGPVAVAEYLRVKSGRAPVYADYIAPPTPTVGTRIWIDTATRANDTDIAGDATETGGFTWTRATSGTGASKIGVNANEFAPIAGSPSGGTILYTVNNLVTSYWLRAVVTVVNQYQRLAIKVIDDQNYIIVFMASTTSVSIRRYDAGVATTLGTMNVDSALSHELHVGWVEAESRLVVEHAGDLVFDGTVTGFNGLTTSGQIIAGVSAANTGRISEIESLTMTMVQH